MGLEANNNITIQTEAAFQRIMDSLQGKTKDDFSLVNLKLTELVEMSNKIKEISSELNN